ncbi:MAG: hypothetical protein V1915_03145 [Candidatus Bathyarchaeota archaeon]
MLSLIGITFQIIAVLIGFDVYTSLYAEIIGQVSESLSLSTFNLVTIAGFALVLGMTGSALLMVVSIFAKSYKEAQQYTSILTTALLIPMLVVTYLPPRHSFKINLPPFCWSSNND